MPLTMAYKLKTRVPVELEGVTPDRLLGKSLGEIERLEAYHGNQKVALGDLFEVGGDSADGQIHLEGDLSGVHFIGRGMINGEIFVHGNAGRHVGEEMIGGRIRVEGHAGDWLGAEMGGGLIEVTGSAGNRVGASLPGGKRGMTDGTILIAGAAGDEVGASMRRGLIGIGGACGDAAGFGMIAGTILVFGRCGRRVGAGMKRGTIGLFGEEASRLLPTFRPAGTFRPVFLRLIARELARLRFAFDPGVIEAELSLFHGDLIALGKGEVWMPVRS
jgi:formylmethanofuran dehydrogenase subunit C